MCTRVLPAVFGRGEDGFPVVLGPVPKADVELYEEAAAICPTAAISAVEA
jgi:ferredoxin